MSLAGIMFRESDVKHYRRGAWVENRAAAADVTVFLSHSHKDKDLVEGVINLLGSLGIRVYVDWLDGDMPETTNAETAARLRTKIVENKRFLLLATNNSLGSRWVPWELGLADGLKGIRNMAVLEVRPDYGTYRGNEYVDLYPKIRDVNGVLKWIPGTYQHRFAFMKEAKQWLS